MQLIINNINRVSSTIHSIEIVWPDPESRTGDKALELEKLTAYRKGLIDAMYALGMKAKPANEEKTEWTAVLYNAD